MSERDGGKIEYSRILEFHPLHLQSDPKKYQFIKEALVALEKEYAEQLRAARERAYEQNRSRLQVGSSNSVTETDDEFESMAVKIVSDHPKSLMRAN